MCKMDLVWIFLLHFFIILFVENERVPSLRGARNNKSSFNFIYMDCKELSLLTRCLHYIFAIKFQRINI